MIALGLISSKLTLEGPLIKNKSSFIVSGRRTYADLLMKPFMQNGENEIDNFNLYFYDLNAKINHKISKKDRVYISAYIGDDIFNVKNTESNKEESKQPKSNGTESDNMRFQLGYGNITSTIRWNHLFNNKLFSNTTFTYSRYNFKTGFSLLSSRPNDTVYNETTQTLNIGESSEEFSYDYISGIQDLGEMY